MKDFKELIEAAKRKGRKDCVVVKAEDETVLEGVKLARDLGLINAILIGGKQAVAACARKVGLDLTGVTVIDADDEKAAVLAGTEEVKKKNGFLMKGMLSTSAFLKGVLDKEHGLRAGRILSHVAVFEIPLYHKLLFMSDGGMNPKLDLNVRTDIVNNAISLLKALGVGRPKIALVAASETVNPDMPETGDAVAIVEKSKKGGIADAVIEGPFGFDVAVSKEAAAHKKMKSEIAGDVDFVLMPNISAANIWAKGLMYFAQTKGAGIVTGAAKPVVMLSRADDAEAKLHSIALGVAVS